VLRRVPRGVALCLDIGQGAFAGLAGRLEPADLAAVVISHLHPDHFVDLVALRHYLRYEFDPPRRLRVIAPAGLAGRLDGVTGEAGFAAGTLGIEDRGEGHVQVGPFDTESRRVVHTANSFATRVTRAAAPDGQGSSTPGTAAAPPTSRHSSTPATCCCPRWRSALARSPWPTCTWTE